MRILPFLHEAATVSEKSNSQFKIFKFHFWLFLAIFSPLLCPLSISEFKQFSILMPHCIVEEKHLNRMISRDLDLHWNMGLRTGQRVSEPDKKMVWSWNLDFCLKLGLRSRRETFIYIIKMGLRTGPKNVWATRLILHYTVGFCDRLVQRLLLYSKVYAASPRLRPNSLPCVTSQGLASPPRPWYTASPGTENPKGPWATGGLCILASYLGAGIAGVLRPSLLLGAVRAPGPAEALRKVLSPCDPSPETLSEPSQEPSCEEKSLSEGLCQASGSYKHACEPIRWTLISRWRYMWRFTRAGNLNVT